MTGRYLPNTMRLAGWIGRLEAYDRSWYLRLALPSTTSRRATRAWIGVTHFGSAAVTIGSAVIPLLIAPPLRPTSLRAALVLTVSHLIIQVIKRFVHRDRPSVRLACDALIPCPDRFSFPSGHATASLSIALVYGLAVPSLAGPLIALALLVGASRVALGVHYPGDVLTGQLIAVATVAALGS